jgi:DNA-binding MarR family transcriptional regulator
MVSFRALVFAFVRDYWARWGQSPSYGEIAAHLASSRTRVKQAVLALAKEGRIVRVPGPRGLRLPTEQEEALRKLAELGWRIDPDSETAVPPCSRSLPPQHHTSALSPLLPPPELTYPAHRDGTTAEQQAADEADPQR